MNIHIRLNTLLGKLHRGRGYCPKQTCYRSFQNEVKPLTLDRTLPIWTKNSSGSGLCLCSRFLPEQIYTKCRFRKNTILLSISRTISTKSPILKTSVKLKPASAKAHQGDLKRLLRLAWPERWHLAGAICLLIVSSAVTMAVPFGIGRVIDTICALLQNDPSKDRDAVLAGLNKLCSVLLFVFILGASCNAGRIYLMSTSGQRITQALREKVFGSILKQDTAFFDKNKTGELVNRLSADSALVSSTLTTNISDGLRSLFSVIIGLSMMFYTSTQLALVGLTVVPPVAALAIVYSRFVRKISKQFQDQLASATQVAEERFSLIRTVKSFGQEKREQRVFSNEMAGVLELAYREAKARAAFFGLAGLTGNCMVLSVLYYGGVLVTDNTLTVGALSSFLIYAAYIGTSLGGLTNAWSELNRGLGAGSRLWELMDKQPAIQTGGVYPPLPPEGHVDFRDVTFAYPSRPTSTILQSLNVKVPAGSFTAVVGASGSGKSTLAALLLRLYDPKQGMILVDNTPVEEYDIEWLRRNIAYVSQEPALFSGSIRENIAYGSAIEETGKQGVVNVGEDEIWRAADLANASEFIKPLPDGLDTVVGERGITLSGGQRQRVAIARALIRDPKILLLDEATSALDSESERLVQEALERIMKNRTVITIAHRLSTVRAADQILVLANGKVVERGSYEDLMNQEEGAFRKLVHLQTLNA